MKSGCTIEEAAQYYGIHRNTFTNWIKPIADQLHSLNPNSRLYTPAQIELIKSHLGSNDE